MILCLIEKYYVNIKRYKSFKNKKEKFLNIKYGFEKIKMKIKYRINKIKEMIYDFNFND